jgi:hypothetical protein
MQNIYFVDDTESLRSCQTALSKVWAKKIDKKLYNILYGKVQILQAKKRGEWNRFLMVFLHFLAWSDNRIWCWMETTDVSGWLGTEVSTALCPIISKLFSQEIK